MMLLRKANQQSILLLTLIVTFFATTAFAVEGVNECALLREKIAENIGKLSLDEPQEKIFESPGIEVEWLNKQEAIITKIYPEARFAFDSEKLSLVDLEDQILATVNGKEVGQMSAEEFDAEWSKEKIEIEVEGSDTNYSLERQEIISYPVFVSLDMDRISKIDSKNSSFNARFRSKLHWTDNRLRELFHQILSDAGFDKNEGPISCDVKKSFLQEVGYFFPEIRIPQFSSTEKPDFTFITVEYFPPSWFEDDEDTEADKTKNGDITLSYAVDFDGTITDTFSLQKFPFDTQTLWIKVYPKSRALGGEFLDLTMSELGDTHLYEDTINLANPEWNLIDTYQEYGHYYYTELDVRNPFMKFVYEFERKPNYYVYKIYLPILFLLIVSWSVFWINPDDLESRSTVSIVCFLSLIAYNFVIDQDLPRVGYLTLMDRSILISYLFSALPTIESVFVKFACERGRANLAKRTDKEFRIYFLPSILFAMLALFIEFDVVTLPD